MLLARNLVLADGTKTQKQLLIDSGYARSTASFESRKIIESAGVQEALKLLGFDEDNAKRVVGEILNDNRKRAQDRLNAADKVFKVFGTYAPEKRVEIQARVDIKDEKLDALRQEYEDRMQKLLQNQT
ncbi:hypothetical protein HY496_01510 [Candidatus Woesearchaeota archaeon]|nr:hypothetical protein [Candidatus Woesearchaeota archaeon]